MASLLGRAVLVAVLSIAFYGLVVGVAVGLLSIPLLEYRASGTMHLRVVLYSWWPAIAHLLASLPGRYRFVPPGPELSGIDEPELFASITEVCAAGGVSPPARVYADASANASVIAVGGIGGVGSTQVLMIGIPLLRGLPSAELRCVLAHEMGHFAAGDTRLSPALYRARRAILRAVDATNDRPLLGRLFRWYGRSFLRITLASARRQELAADLFSASVCSREDAARALLRVHAMEAAFTSYLNVEVLPVVREGFIPPVSSGFVQFLSKPANQARCWEVAARAWRASTADVDDSHPSLRQRLHALGFESLPECPPFSPVASGETQLAVDPWLVEQRFGVEVRQHRTISWAATGHDVILPMYSRMLATSPPLPVGTTIGGLARFVRESRPAEPVTTEVLERAGSFLGAALAVTLTHHGWSLVNEVGTPIQLRHGHRILLPFAMVGDLLRGVYSEQEWVRCCDETAIAHLDMQTHGGEPVQPGGAIRQAPAIRPSPARAKAMKEPRFEGIAMAAGLGIVLEWTARLSCFVIMLPLMVLHFVVGVPSQSADALFRSPSGIAIFAGTVATWCYFAVFGGWFIAKAIAGSTWVIPSVVGAAMAIGGVALRQDGIVPMLANALLSISLGSASAILGHLAARRSWRCAEPMFRPADFLMSRLMVWLDRLAPR